MTDSLPGAIDRCPLEDDEAYMPVEVNVCPCCGGDVEETDTPTMHRCSNSGVVFYVET